MYPASQSPPHPRLQSHWPTSLPPQNATHFHPIKPLLTQLSHPGISPSFTPPPTNNQTPSHLFKTFHLNYTLLLFTSPPKFYLALAPFCFDGVCILSMSISSYTWGIPHPLLPVFPQSILLNKFFSNWIVLGIPGDLAHHTVLIA